MTAPTEPSFLVMAERPKPQLGRVFQAEYRLLLRSVCTKGRLAAIGALALLSMITALIASTADGDSLDMAVHFVNDNVATLIPVAVLVFGAATLGDLIDDGSLVYLWLRPVPAWIHVAAAWAATVTVVIPIVLIPMLISTSIIDASTSVLGAALLGGLIATAAYAGVFVMLGVRFKRALPWGLVYILIWEGFIASAGQTATKLAVRSYVRSILTSMTGVELKLAQFSLATGIVVPLLAALAALAYASRRLGRSDVA